MESHISYIPAKLRARSRKEIAELLLTIPFVVGCKAHLFAGRKAPVIGRSRAYGPAKEYRIRSHPITQRPDLNV
jgi:hypothetical protein